MVSYNDRARKGLLAYLARGGPVRQYQVVCSVELWCRLVVKRIFLTCHPKKFMEMRLSHLTYDYALT